MFFPYKEGYIEVICGCMFSGKTEELIRRVKVLSYAHKNIIVFKAKIDDRYSKTQVVSHDGTTIDSIPIEKAADIYPLVPEGVDVIAIDEAQFLDEGIVELASYYADLGKRVILAGLDLDFRAESFGSMPELMARAEFVDKLTAVCAVCHAPATRSQRLINGKPASYKDAQIQVGATESYQPRCRHCHVMHRE